MIIKLNFYKLIKFHNYELIHIIKKLIVLLLKFYKTYVKKQ